jgi:short subunit dehydrogenase-like uncharacterized protein
MTEQQAEVRILGAAGRAGRALAPRIAARTALVPVLVGRDPGRLAEVAAGLGRAGRTVVAASAAAMAGRPLLPGRAARPHPAGIQPAAAHGP